MQETETLKQLLDVKDPWEIDNIEVTASGERLDIHVRSSLVEKVKTSRLRRRHKHRHKCSKCNLKLTAETTDEPKVWRHVNLGGKHCYVHAQAPSRPPCAGRGCPFLAPWGDLDSPFTAAMQYQFTKALWLCGDPTQACRLLALSPEDVRKDQRLDMCTTHRRDYRPEPALESYIPAKPAQAPEYDIPTTIHTRPVGPTWVRSPGGLESNGVPAVSHPNWQRLLNEELSIDIKTLGLQMLLTRIRSAISQDMTTEERHARISEMRDYCIKYRRFVEYELTQLFEHP